MKFTVVEKPAPGVLGADVAPMRAADLLALKSCQPISGPSALRPFWLG